MKQNNYFSIKHLDLISPVGIILETLFISIAVFLPSFLHPVLGNKVFILLPMHWTIILSGLIFGWEAGIIAGLSAPIISHLLTGMPVLDRLPLMVIELGCYGFLSGLLTRNIKLNVFIALIISLITGRVAYIITALVLSKVSFNNLITWTINTFKPSLITVLAQIIILPLFAILITYLLNKNKE